MITCDISFRKHTFQLFHLSTSKLSGTCPWALWQTLYYTVILICFHAAEHFEQDESATERTLCPESEPCIIPVAPGCVHCCHALLPPLKGNDDQGDWDFALPAMHIRHSDLG